MDIEDLYKVLFTDESRDKDKKLILFGASDDGKRNLDYLRKSGSKKNVDYFCDNNTALHGKRIDGIKVISPDELNNIEDKIIIITSMYEAEIREQLKDMKIENYF